MEKKTMELLVVLSIALSVVCLVVLLLFATAVSMKVSAIENYVVEKNLGNEVNVWAEIPSGASGFSTNYTFGDVGND